MQIVTDMGAHGAYIWPSYAAFVVIFGAMIVWAVVGNRRARTRLAALEARRKARK
jgi:heme exporter protein CcmD